MTHARRKNHIPAKEMILDEKAHVPVSVARGLEDLDGDAPYRERILGADASVDGAASKVLDLLALCLGSDEDGIGERIEDGGVSANVIGVPVCV